MKKAWILLLLSLHLGAFSPEESGRFPATQPPKRLYEAHGIDGLSTTCNDSARAALLALGGAQGAHECPLQRTRRGHVKISFEQLLGYQPEAILLYERELLETIQRDPKWQLLHAVKNRRLYLVPSEPFN